MGNICRSPTAEGVFRHAVVQAGLERSIVCDSAGTHDYHVGEPPDERARRAATQRGYDISNLRGRQVNPSDFVEFDYLLAMDQHNLAWLHRICPEEHAHKLALYCDYHEQYAGGDVPDPYYGDANGFERVLDMAEQISRSLLDRLRRTGRA